MSNPTTHLRHLTSGLDGRFRGITILSVSDHAGIFGADIVDLGATSLDPKRKPQAPTLS